MRGRVTRAQIAVLSVPGLLGTAGAATEAVDKLAQRMYR